MPSITTLTPLSPSDLRRVLTEVKGSLLSQYTALFGYSGIELRFTNAALDQICKKAAARGGGARGLRGIMVGCHPLISGYADGASRWFAGITVTRSDVRSTVSSSDLRFAFCVLTWMHVQWIGRCLSQWCPDGGTHSFRCSGSSISSSEKLRY